MQYIKQIFEGNVEDWVHERFVRYGKGEFKGPVLTVKKLGKGVKVTGSWEYATGLAVILAGASQTVQVKGLVFAKRDLSQILPDFLSVLKEKKKKSLYNAEVSGEFDADAFKGLYSMIPDAVLLLDVVAGKNKLKSKKKLPKPGSKQIESFCSASFDKTILEAVNSELLFDVSTDYSELVVTHNIFVDDIVPPVGVTDPARIRMEAKRKGKLERIVLVDGKESKSSIELLI